jgi:hypothetical protein
MMLKCAIYVSLVGAFAVGNPKTEEPLKSAILLSLPKLDWALEVGGAELIVQEKEIAPGGKSARFMAVDWTTGILISAFLEDQGRPATAEECRDFYFARLKNSPAKQEDIVRSKFGDMAVAEYIVKEFAGRKADQKNVNAYLTKGNVWIDIHLSKLYFKEEQRELFNTILRTVKLSPRESGQKVRVSYRITDQTVLRLDVPPGGSDKIKPGSGERPPAIRMGPPPEGSTKVLIWVLALKEETPDGERATRLRKTVEDQGAEALARSVEKTLDVRPFQGRSASGYVFTLTNKSPDPNQAKYLTQGGCGAGTLLLLFTALSEEKDSDVSRLALEMLGNMQAVTDRPRRAPTP